MSIKVQEGREMQENYLEDETVLTSYMHDMRAAREDADRELAHMRKMAEDAHKDWMRKLKDRRKEVSQLDKSLELLFSQTFEANFAHCNLWAKSPGVRVVKVNQYSTFFGQPPYYAGIQPQNQPALQLVCWQASASIHTHVVAP